MKIEQTKKLAVNSSKQYFELVDRTDQVCSRQCFEVVDGTDQVSNIPTYLLQGDADLV